MSKPSKAWPVLCAICALSLQGCTATLPSYPIESRTLPAAPSLSTLPPAQPYSKDWQSEVEEWRSAVQASREKLIGMPLTPD